MNNLKLRKKFELLRGGPNFDPVKYVKEVSHVKHMHANSILIHPNFSSKLVITWLNLFENLLLIRFQSVRKLNFDPVQTIINQVTDQFINQVIMNCPKTHFWSTSISSNRTKMSFRTVY